MNLMIHRFRGHSVFAARCSIAGMFGLCSWPVLRVSLEHTILALEHDTVPKYDYDQANYSQAFIQLFAMYGGI